MRITMMTTSAGPTGAMQAGRSYEVSDAEARELIAGGFAVPADRTIKVDRAERAAGTDAPPATARAKPAPRQSRK